MKKGIFVYFILSVLLLLLHKYYWYFERNMPYFASYYLYLLILGACTALVFAAGYVALNKKYGNLRFIMLINAALFVGALFIPFSEIYIDNEFEHNLDKRNEIVSLVNNNFDEYVHNIGDFDCIHIDSSPYSYTEKYKYSLSGRSTSLAFDGLFAVIPSEKEPSVIFNVYKLADKGVYAIYSPNGELNAEELFYLEEGDKYTISNQKDNWYTLKIN